jgi:hypothetical protein
MTLKCSLCKQSFTSLIITPEIALNEVSTMLFSHLRKHHEVEAKQLTNKIFTLGSILPWILEMQLADWNRVEETFLDTQVLEWSKRILQILGVGQNAHEPKKEL